MTDFILEIPLNVPVTDLVGLFGLKPDIDVHLNTPGYEFMAWGDPVFSGDPFIARDKT